MNDQLMEQLKCITSEEQRILNGEQTVEMELYSTGNGDHTGDNLVEAKKLLETGKLIQVRKHTRFVHFPKHKHDYVEMIYVCSGSTRHRIGGHDVVVHAGEILLLNQKTSHEIFPAGEDDIAINFIILPEFFDDSIRMMDQENNALRQFVIDCLKGDRMTAGYLHFKVTDVLPIQNLIENLIWTIHNRQPNKRSINQATMGLLFLQLMDHMDRLDTDTQTEEQKLVLRVLQYVETHYRDGELSELADQLHYDLYWLSREIKKQTGATYTELVQKKRLSQAGFLLIHTSMSVLDVGLAVGYENQSYFHKIFRNEFGVTPRKYRLEHQKQSLFANQDAF